MFIRRMNDSGFSIVKYVFIWATFLLVTAAFSFLQGGLQIASYTYANVHTL